VPTGAPTCPPNVAWTTAGLVLVTMPPPVTRQPVPGGSQPVTVQTALVVAETKPTPPSPSCGSPQIASSPVARTVLVNEPQLVGTVLLENAAVSPGNSTIGPSKIEAIEFFEHEHVGQCDIAAIGHDATELDRIADGGVLAF